MELVEPELVEHVQKGPQELPEQEVGLGDSHDRGHDSGSFVELLRCDNALGFFNRPGNEAGLL